MIGRVFNDRYRVTERIGIGGMAEVYKAQDTVLRRTVAIKVMLPQYAADPEFSERFKLEAAAAANLQNPYIVNVYDWGQDDGTYFIVMEYIRGTDLKSAVKQRGAINQRKVAEIGSQVCQALTTAHGQDIVHRDIKPQNIMVQPDGNVKVMDFGIARAKNSLKAQTSSVLGTAHYISPEQAQGKEIDGTSDIYSLGCVLYEAATGQLPFDAPDAVSVAMMQVSDQPLLPSQIKPDIDPTLEAIILKAMEKVPANRFATARDMKRALDDYLMGRPSALGYADAQTNVLPMSTPMGAMNGVSGGTAVMPVMPSSPANSGPINKTYRDSSNDIKMPEKKKTGKTVAIVTAILVVLLAIGGAVMAFSSGGSIVSSGVPKVMGKTVDAAEQALTEAGYVLGEVTEEYSAEVVSGRVMSQDPEAGSKPEKGTKVNLVVSKGPEKCTVPDLRGMTTEEAEAALKASGLKGKQGNADYSDMDKGKVFKQDVDAGKTADKDSEVVYYISLGKETATVPIVINYAKNDAVNALKNAGFRVETVDGGYSDQYSEGVVMEQTPNGGQLEKGETVTITISKGKDPATLPVDVPNVVGMTRADAEATLANAGFSYEVEEKYSSAADQGIVFDQDITGSRVPSKTTITISVSKGPRTINEQG